MLREEKKWNHIKCSIKAEKAEKEKDKWDGKSYTMLMLIKRKL